MRIEKITGNKKQYLDLLLLADEQEDMIDRYLEFPFTGTNCLTISAGINAGNRTRQQQMP